MLSEVGDRNGDHERASMWVSRSACGGGSRHYRGLRRGGTGDRRSLPRSRRCCAHPDGLHPPRPGTTALAGAGRAAVARFLSGLGSAAAQDVAQDLERLVGRVVGGKHKTASPQQVLVLQDAATRPQVVLEADLPAEAYEALVALDLSAFRQGAGALRPATRQVALGARRVATASGLTIQALKRGQPGVRAAQGVGHPPGC